MKLLILSINYWPEPTGFAPHVTALAEHLARAGNKVTVLTGFPFAPRWHRWPDYRRELVRRENLNGVCVVRITHFVPRLPGSVWQRLAMEGTFALSGAAALLNAVLRRASRPDAVVYVGAQPAIAMLARLLAAVARAPYIVNVNDLAAQAASDVGIVRSAVAQRILEEFEFAAYRGAAGAIVLCRSFGETLVARGFPETRIRLIRSPIDLDLVRPLDRDPAHRSALGLPADAFVVLFAGSMGLKQGLSNVVEAARQLRERGAAAPPIVWTIVGDGETRVQVEELVAANGLGKIVRLLPLQPDECLSAMFAAADTLLLNQLSSVKDTVIPSKLLTYMAAGRPVLAAVSAASQGAEILRHADGGVLVEPENPAALARAAESLASADPSALAEMGRRNRAYAERHFDQKTVLAAHERFITECVANS